MAKVGFSYYDKLADYASLSLQDDISFIKEDNSIRTKGRIWTKNPDWNTTDVNDPSFIKNKPNSFKPATHNHTIDDILELQDNLNNLLNIDASNGSVDAIQNLLLNIRSTATTPRSTSSVLFYDTQWEKLTFQSLYLLIKDMHRINNDYLPVSEPRFSGSIQGCEYRVADSANNSRVSITYNNNTGLLEIDVV